MKKVVTKGFYIVGIIILFIGASLHACAQYTNTNFATGGLYTAAAKDASNNLYITTVQPETGGMRYQVEKFTNGTGTPSVIYKNLTHEIGDYPWGLAVTSTGNVFISTDFTSNAGAIIELTYSGGAYTPTTFQTGRYFTALAVDASDNLYDTEYDATNSTYAVVEYTANSAPNSAGTNLYDNLKSGVGYAYPTGLAVASNGDIYVADAFSNTPSITDGGHVYKLVKASAYAATTVSTGLYSSALALDASGNLFSSENSGSGYQLVEYKNGTGTGTPVFTPMHTNGIYYPWGIALISDASIFVVDGDNGTDGGAVIKLVMPSPVTVKYTTPKIYNSGTPIVPLAPVSTNGAAQSYNYLPITLTSGFDAPGGIASSASGTIYVSNTTAGSVTEFPAGGGAPVSIGSGFSSPYGLAVDVSGNVYVADFNNNAVKEVPVGGGAPVSIGSGFTNPVGVAVDAAGNVYVADYGNGAVKEIPVGGGPVVTLGGGFTGPTGVALDGQGNVYVTDYAANNVKEILAGGNTTVTLATGFSNPFNLTVDGAGNVYVADFSNSEIKEIPAGSSTTIILASGFAQTTGVAIDGPGNLYVTDYGNNAIKQIKPAGGYFVSPFLPLGLTINSNTGVISGTPPKLSPATNYTVTAWNAASSASSVVSIKIVPNATLASLTTSTGTFSPVFTALTTSYTAKVTYATTAFTVTPIVSDPLATVTVNGVTVKSGMPSQSLPLNVGANTITTVVTAQDGVTTKTYIITATRVASNLSTNALLASIKTNPAETLNGTTGPGYLNFTAGATNATTSIQVIPTAKDATATITVNGVAVASGADSQSIPLVVGSNTITTVITAQDGVTMKTVIITITRAPSSNAGLSNLALSSGTLNPAFATATTTYSASVGNAISSIKITPTTADPTATVTVNDVAVKSGTPSASIPLSVGVNSIATVVIAQDGVTTKTYTTSITRISNNASLTSIKLTPASTLTVTGSGATFVNYSTTVPNTTSSVTVTPIAQDGTATIKVNGVTVKSGAASASIPLALGSNVITTVVTAQDGTTTKTYTITATRLGSSDALLTSIKLTPTSALTVVTGPSYVNYTTSVPNTTSSVTVTATVQDATATIKVNGVTTASGVPSASIPVAVGTNVINTVVTAQDGVTTKTYTITLTRAPSTDALLTSIKLTPASTLTVVTGPGYVNYTTSVPNATTSVTVTATTQDATATIQVNGVTTASGVASASIPLAVGSNTINTVVTAQDGVTTKTYIITATRAAPAGSSDLFSTISVTKPTENIQIDDGIVVHQGVSPNGDGVNDFLTIDGITNYPDNRLMIMDRNGVLIYQTKGYDNSSKLFDGHSNINGKMQLPGTYFYTLDYKVNGENKHKTGYIILKY
jgi:gliding motility-associated-like protein